MKYLNTAFLREQFTRDGAKVFVDMDGFILEDSDFAKHLAEIQTHSKESLEIQRDRAAYRCLTFNQTKAPDPRLPSSDPKLQMLLSQVQQLTTAQQESVQHANEFRKKQALEYFDTRIILRDAMDQGFNLMKTDAMVYAKEHRDQLTAVDDAQQTVTVLIGSLGDLASDQSEALAAFTKTYQRDKRILLATGVLLFLIEIFTH